MKVIDIAKTILPQAKPKIIGIRPGEKLHEQMISKDDSNSTYEYDGYFTTSINEWDIDNTRIKDGKRVPKGLSILVIIIQNGCQILIYKNGLKIIKTILVKFKS